LKKYYAKAKITHGDFRKNNLYEITREILPTDTVLLLRVKVRDEYRTEFAKRDNFEIVSCIFNEEKAE